MTTPIIARNFFKLTEKQLMKIGRQGSGVLGKMEESVKNLSESVLDTVAHQSRGEGYLLKDQFIKLRTTGRKGGEYFKVQSSEITADLTPVKPVKVRTETRGKQSVEAFTQEKLNLIAKFKNALRDETSEHVSVKFATEGGGLRRRKITDQTVDRYKEAVAAFNHPDNGQALIELGMNANKVETKILKQGQFQIHQTIPAVQDAEGKITARAQKYTLNLVQGKLNPTEYVNNGIQVAKRIQERPETIGKKFTLTNTTTRTLNGRVPSAQKTEQYDAAVNAFNKNEREIKNTIEQRPDYAEGNYSRRLTGQNQYVVTKTVEGPKERYVMAPHKESLEQFTKKANNFAEEVAFQCPEISPKLMLKNGHLVDEGIARYTQAKDIFRQAQLRNLLPANDVLALRMKGNGKFSIKDVAAQTKGTESGASAPVAEKLKSLKLRQGNQDFESFVRNGIGLANLKKQHTQYMSESFGVKGNWLTGNRIKAKGLELRMEANEFFNADANATQLQALKDAGLSFKLRKHGKIALQYGENTTWVNAPVKSISQRNNENLTGFLTRGVEEAKTFVAEQEQKAAKKTLEKSRPSSLTSAGKQRFHEQLQEELSKLDQQVLPDGFAIAPKNGNLEILKNGRKLETLRPEAFDGKTASVFVQEAIEVAHRFEQAVPVSKKPSLFSGLKSLQSSGESSESTGRPGFLKSLFSRKGGSKKSEATPPLAPPHLHTLTPEEHRASFLERQISNPISDVSIRERFSGFRRPETPLESMEPTSFPVSDIPVPISPVRMHFNSGAASPTASIRLSFPEEGFASGRANPIGVAFSNEYERIPLGQMGLREGLQDGGSLTGVTVNQPTLIGADVLRQRSVKGRISTPKVPLHLMDESHLRFRTGQYDSFFLPASVEGSPVLSRVSTPVPLRTYSVRDSQGRKIGTAADL
jgi:hypothetical protein